MKALIVIPTILGVFLPHLWSVFIIVRGIPLLYLGGIRLEPLYLPILFATFRLVENLPSNSVFAWSEFAFLLVVAVSLQLVVKWSGTHERHYFLFGLLGGSTLLSVCALLNFLDSIYLVKPWMAYPAEVQKKSSTSFKALTSNAIINRDLGFIGPGTLTVSVRMRHQDLEGRSLEMPLTLVRQSGPSRPDTVCYVSAQWSTCATNVYLPTREHTTLWLGGWDYWSKDNAAILEVSGLRISYQNPPPLWQVLANSGRIAGFTFNPNALGLASLVGIMLIGILSKKPWPATALTAMPFLLLLLLSGSRASLGGLVLFILILLIKPLRWARTVGYIAPLFVLLTIYAGFHWAPGSLLSLSLPRIVNPFGELYDESRVSLYVEVLSRMGFSLAGERNYPKLLGIIREERGLGPLEHAHSLWLQVYGVSGLLGLAAFMFLFLKTESQLSHRKNRVSIAAFFALYFVSFFDYFAFYPPYYILLFGIALLAWAPFKETRQEQCL